MNNNTEDTKSRISRVKDRVEDIREKVDSGNLSDEQRESALDTVKEVQTRVSELKIPETKIDTTSAEEMIDTTPTDQLAILEEQRQAELDRLQRERDEAREERAELKDQLGQVFDDRKPMEEKLKETQKEMGVLDMLDQQREQLTAIQDLRNRATNLIEQRDAAIGAIGQQAISTPFIKGQQARIAENYDRRINTISSYMGTEVAMYEAAQGNIQTARSMVSQIVDAYTYDTKMELEKVSTFIDLNSEEISMLDQEYQNTLQESQRHWEKQLEEEKTEREAVLNLKLEYAKAGITIDDDLETAVKKSSKWLGIQPDADVKELMAEYPEAGIKEKDSYTEAIKKIAEQPYIPEWELRNVGKDLVRVDPETGATEVLATGTEATPTSYKEWQLAGSPGTFQEWMTSQKSSTLLSPGAINSLAAKGVSEADALKIAEAIRRGDTVEGPVADKVRDEMLGSQSVDELTETLNNLFGVEE